MEIKASTMYDFETMKYFFRFHYFRSMAFIKVCIILSILALYYILCAIVFDFFMFSNIILLFILFLLAVVFYQWLRGPKRAYKKSNDKLRNLKTDYIFDEKNIRITTSADNYSGTAEMNYNVIIKAYETTEYFYLLVNTKTAYAVDKKGFQEGTALDLRNLLLSKLPSKKYKIQKGRIHT